MVMSADTNADPAHYTVWTYPWDVARLGVDAVLAEIAGHGLHGIDLAATRLLCVKAKNHFRAAFQPVCRRIIDVSAPGPAAVDLRQLPFRHAPRHLHPLSA
jgi:microcystin degradation protein MlrC